MNVSRSAGESNIAGIMRARAAIDRLELRGQEELLADLHSNNPLIRDNARCNADIARLIDQPTDLRNESQRSFLQNHPHISRALADSNAANDAPTTSPRAAFEKQIALLSATVEGIKVEVRSFRNPLQIIVLRHHEAALTNSRAVLEYLIQRDTRIRALTESELELNRDRYRAFIATAMDSVRNPEAGIDALLDIVQQGEVLAEKSPIASEHRLVKSQQKLMVAMYRMIGRLRLASLAARNVVRPDPERVPNLRIDGIMGAEIARKSTAMALALQVFTNDPSFQHMQSLRKAASEYETALFLARMPDNEIVEDIGSVFSHSLLHNVFHSYLIDQSQPALDASRRLTDEEFLNLQSSIQISRAAPVRKTKKKRGLKPASGRVRNDTRAEAIDYPNSELDARIALTRTDAHAPRRFEGDMAAYTRELCEKQLTSFAQVVGFNVILRDDRRVLAEFDVLTNVAILELTLRDSGKFAQIRKRALNENNINPNRLPVVLFAPNYTHEATAELEKINRLQGSSRVMVAHTKPQFDTIMHELDEQLFATTATNIRANSH